jgi:glycosyltransferase involved in cell wall biosynthesis
MRKWDAGNADGVHHYAAISHYIADRIKRVYNREATVIYPPVETEEFEFQTKKEDFYFTMSRMVPYKRIDLIVEAFSQMPSKRLVVIGGGPEMERIKKLAGKNIELLGFQPDHVMRQYLSKARAFVFAAQEDFGIAPVEAQACGTPVIAFGKGGSLETIINGETGIFFNEQSVSSLIEAIEKFERREFDPQRLKLNAERFNRARFKREFKQFVEEKWEDFSESHHSCRR